MVSQRVGAKKPVKGDKLKISVSISRFLKNQMDELVEKGYFASVSEIVSLATMKFLTELEAKGKLKKTDEESE